MDKINAYRLRKEEVSYELKIRGISGDGDANELRKRLTHALNAGTPIEEKVVASLVTENELDCCEDKFSDLKSLVKAYYEDLPNEAEYLRISTRLNHLLQRVSRIPINEDSEDNEEETSRKEELLKDIKEFVDELSNKTTKPNTEDQGPSDPMKQVPGPENKPDEIATPMCGDLKTTDNTKTEELENRNETKPLVRSNFQNSQENHLKDKPARLSKTVPVFKWGLKFDNESGQSVGAFLERVEELRRACGLSEEDLFESAVDLFSGSALIWYRSTISRIN